MIPKNTTLTPLATPTTMTPANVMGNNSSIRQKVFDHIAPGITPGPITSVVKKAEEVSPKVLKKSNEAELSAIEAKLSAVTSNFNLDDITPKNSHSSTSSDSNSDVTKASEANAVILKPAAPVNPSDIKAGDIIFTVVNDKSPMNNQFVKWGQSYQRETYAEHQDKLPVDISQFVHCDIAIGDGKIAHPGEPRVTGELMRSGLKTPTDILEIASYNTQEDYVVLRPKNNDVAQLIAEKAKELIEVYSPSYNVPGVLKNGLLGIANNRAKAVFDSAKESVKQTNEYAPNSLATALMDKLDSVEWQHSLVNRDNVPRLLKGDEQGPQEGPLTIPNNMYCSEFGANMILHAEREILRGDRSAPAESLTMTELSPAKLVSELAGSGNFEIFKVDKSEWEKNE